MHKKSCAVYYWLLHGKEKREREGERREKISVYYQTVLTQLVTYQSKMLPEKYHKVHNRERVLSDSMYFRSDIAKFSSWIIGWRETALNRTCWQSVNQLFSWEKCLKLYAVCIAFSIFINDKLGLMCSHKLIKFIELGLVESLYVLVLYQTCNISNYLTICLRHKHFFCFCFIRFFGNVILVVKNIFSRSLSLSLFLF